MWPVYDDPAHHDRNGPGALEHDGNKQQDRTIVRGKAPSPPKHAHSGHGSLLLRTYMTGFSAKSGGEDASCWTYTIAVPSNMNWSAGDTTYIDKHFCTFTYTINCFPWTLKISTATVCMISSAGHSLNFEDRKHSSIPLCYFDRSQCSFPLFIDSCTVAIAEGFRGMHHICIS